jgi:hypothetical protein
MGCHNVSEYGQSSIVLQCEADTLSVTSSTISGVTGGTGTTFQTIQSNPLSVCLNGTCTTQFPRIDSQGYVQLNPSYRVPVEEKTMNYSDCGRLYDCTISAPTYAYPGLNFLMIAIGLAALILASTVACHWLAKAGLIGGSKSRVRTRKPETTDDD